jgi:hypothetical protein
VTTIKVIHLVCDALKRDGTICNTMWQPAPEELASAAMQRRAARAAGWLVERKTDPRDVCPGEHL